MAYKTTTILDIIEKANGHDLVLPSIQRKYVWVEEQIEALFDSIYKGYPIGTFLIWQINKDEINNYIFYELLKHYNEMDNGNFNRMYPKEQVRDSGLLATLDGQQRITSLYIALQGSFKRKITRARKDKPENYITKYLFFNLTNACRRPTYGDDQNPNFKMMTETEAANDRLNVWKITKSFVAPDWRQAFENEDKFFSLTTQILNDHGQRLGNIDDMTRVLFNARIKKLVQVLIKDENISYYQIGLGKKLDEVLEIFIRVNSGGKTLTKSELLFSTVVSRWENGREEIDQLIKDIQGQYEYEIDTDFVMRTCLYVTNSPILFKVESFKESFVVDRIISLFNNEEISIDIKTAILKAFQFLRKELNIPEKTLASKNAVIPIVYHIFKKGNLGDASVFEVRKYLYLSLLQKVFGSHGDTLLSQLRNSVTDSNGNYILSEKDFNFKGLINGITDSEKINLYNIDQSIIEDFFLEKEIGPEGWLVLNLVYPNLNYNYNSYDQDHLHPKTKFKKKEMSNAGLTQFNNDFEIRRDKIPNLALLTNSDNREAKKDKHLNEFLNSMTDANKLRDFKNRHYIDELWSLDFKDFLKFYEERKKKLSKKMCEQLGVSYRDTPEPVQPEIFQPKTRKELIGFKIAEFDFLFNGEPNTQHCLSVLLKHLIDKFDLHDHDSMMQYLLFDSNRVKDKNDPTIIDSYYKGYTWTAKYDTGEVVDFANNFERTKLTNDNLILYFAET